MVDSAEFRQKDVRDIADTADQGRGGNEVDGEIGAAAAASTVSAQVIIAFRL
jgi:hypothetical protein